jgi:bifunctional non-homologous end joining protein LigD
MIWDQGTYNPEVEIEKGVRKQIEQRAAAERTASESLKSGNLKFFLFGKKLKGSFALVRTAGIAGRESWLLIKHRDQFALDGYDAKDFDFSAESNRSLADIAATG